MLAGGADEATAWRQPAAFSRASQSPMPGSNVDAVARGPARGNALP